MTNTIKNILIDTDAYKTSMYMQYPPNAEYVSSYVEARKNPYKLITFYGLQHILEMLSTKLTTEDVSWANRYWTAQGMPFNKNGWLRLVEKHNGKLPLKITALPEGTRLDHGNVLVQVVNTDPEFFWLTTWVETAILRVWYPTTVATLSAAIRDDIYAALVKTSDDPMAELPFKLHDFGARGVNSAESAGIGGSAHLINFMGSDTGLALAHAMEYYNAPMDGVAGSIPAAEHSTITSWGQSNESTAFKNMIDKFGSGLVAVVSDSYDIYNAATNIWGKELKDKVINMDGMLIVRPDSGDPESIPVEVVALLDAQFGHTVNDKGYKVLNNVRVIQGDGINRDSINVIMSKLINRGYSITNIAFGMGGALLSRPERDDLSFAMNCSAVCINGEWSDVFKNPITDHGKTSKKGILASVVYNGKYTTIKQADLIDPRTNKLEVVFENGEVIRHENWNDVKKRAALII